VRIANVIVFVACIAAAAAMLVIRDQSPRATPLRPVADAADAEPGRVAEARLRSQLLHETIHGSLQVMHRDFFREADRQSIPSASMEDVFSELEKTYHVKVKWMAVNAKVMNIKNRPKTEFDKLAADAIADGLETYEASADGEYQYAGKITLGNQCLKCHVPERTSLEDRKAAVVISMPLDLRERLAK
jgi:hypothetical protein